MELLPSPMDKESVKGTNPDTGEEETRKPDYNEPFTALGLQNCNRPVS
jgi:elongation factor G